MEVASEENTQQNTRTIPARGTIKAIIFDMDGVLFDSEPLHMVAWNRTLIDSGLSYSDDFYREWVGIPDEDLAKWLEERHNNGNEPVFLEKKREIFRQIVREQLKPFDNLMPWLEKFSSMIKTGVSTSSRRTELDLMLEVTGVNKYIHESSSFNDVTRHKPAPDVYLLTAKKLNIEPHQIVSIEDSPSGIGAVRAAGIFSLAVTTSFPAEKLNEADLVFGSTPEACQWIAENLL